MSFSLVNQFNRRIESLDFPAWTSEPGEKHTTQKTAQVSKIVHSGSAETNQQVDTGYVQDIHQSTSGAISKQLAVLENEQPFRRQ